MTILQAWGGGAENPKGSGASESLMERSLLLPRSPPHLAPAFSLLPSLSFPPVLSIPLPPTSLPFLLSTPTLCSLQTPSHLQVPGCSRAAQDLREPAAPPSGCSRDRRGASLTRRKMLVLPSLPPGGAHPPGPFPVSSSAARGLESGCSASTLTSIPAPALSPLTTLITSQALLPEDQEPELMSLITECLPSHSPCSQCCRPKDASALCSPGRGAPRSLPAAPGRDTALMVGSLCVKHPAPGHPILTI